jgi:hypothetical protein
VPSPVRRLFPASAIGLGYEKTPGRTSIERACLILCKLKEDALSTAKTRTPRHWDRRSQKQVCPLPLHCLAVDPRFVGEAILVVEAYEVGVLNRNRVGQALIWSATLQMGDNNLSPFQRLGDDRGRFIFEVEAIRQRASIDSLRAH